MCKIDVVNTAAVFYKDGKILLMRRAQGHSAAGGWEYPGGKVEPGESAKDSIKRELKEELDIDATIGEMLAETPCMHNGQTIHLMAFQINEYQGIITLIDHDAMEWVELNQLLSHEQLPSDYEISKQLVNYFSIK